MTIYRSLEAWCPADGIAVLRFSDGCLIADVPRGIATWQGERLRIATLNVPTLYGMMTGAFGKGKNPAGDRGSQTRRAIGAHGFWTRRENGVLEIVKGWEAEAGQIVATREDKFREWSKIKALPGDRVPLCRAMSQECPTGSP